MKRIYGCIFDDEIGLANRDVIGMDQICFETDYPHADSTFPHSKATAEKICSEAGLNEEETYKFIRGNAIRAFGLERFGITKYAVARPLLAATVALRHRTRQGRTALAGVLGFERERVGKRHVFAATVEAKHLARRRRWPRHRSRGG